MRARVVAAMILAGAGVAAAADFPQMPAKAPPAYQRVYDWTGLYVGVNVGGGWANATSAFSVAPGPAFASVDNSLPGAVGGGQLGYNWQSGGIVFGVEADFQASSLKGGLDAPCPPVICTGLVASFNQKMPWFGTARGRVGYASDGWMIYATGGYAYARFDTDAFASAGGLSLALSRHETRSGWAAGGGIEVALSRNWSARVEYLYFDFGTHNGSWTLPGLAVINDATKLNANVARAGVNYRF
jgi:outer membrane immunogenic protein